MWYTVKSCPELTGWVLGNVADNLGKLDCLILIPFFGLMESWKGQLGFAVYLASGISLCTLGQPPILRTSSCILSNFSSAGGLPSKQWWYLVGLSLLHGCVNPKYTCPLPSAFAVMLASFLPLGLNRSFLSLSSFPIWVRNFFLCTTFGHFLQLLSFYFLFKLGYCPVFYLKK